ncbi:TrkH family potassium uptake protein [soil metagenome]
MDQRPELGSSPDPAATPRRSRTIFLPTRQNAKAVPHVRQHSKTFALGLFIIMLVGGLLLATPWTSASGTRAAPIDAIFTAVSAASVTGLASVDTKQQWNGFGQVVMLLLVQTGGLGFMVGAGIVLQMLRRGQTRLRDELMMQDGAPTLSLREAIQLSRRIVRFTFVVEGIGALILAIWFSQQMPWDRAIWHGVFYAVSAFCNAGFDLTGNFAGLTPYRSSITVNIVIMLLIQAGTLSYIVLEDVVKARRWSRFALDTKLVLLVNAILVVGGAIFFLLAEWNHSLASTAMLDRPLSALFQSVSARGSGYGTVDWTQAQAVTLFVWLGIMFIGGASGSTAGGVKLATAGVIGATVISTLKGREDPSAFGRRIATTIVFRAIAVVFIMLLVFFAGTLALAVSENIIQNSSVPFESLMFETMSALGTVGLSAGLTPTLSTAGKIVLCAVMFIGRLGPLTAVYALQRRQKRSARYRYPIAPIRIG